MSDKDSRGGTGYPLHIVVFSQPVTLEAEGFSALRGLERYRKCFGDSAFFAYRNEIKHGKRSVAKGFHGLACWHFLGSRGLVRRLITPAVQSLRPLGRLFHAALGPLYQ